MLLGRRGGINHAGQCGWSRHRHVIRFPGDHEHAVSGCGRRLPSRAGLPRRQARRSRCESQPKRYSPAKCTRGAHDADMTRPRDSSMFVASKPTSAPRSTCNMLVTRPRISLDPVRRCSVLRHAERVSLLVSPTSVYVDSALVDLPHAPCPAGRGVVEPPIRSGFHTARRLRTRGEFRAYSGLFRRVFRPGLLRQGDAG